jgi:hypothetical protein
MTLLIALIFLSGVGAALLGIQMYFLRELFEPAFDRNNHSKGSDRSEDSLTFWTIVEPMPSQPNQVGCVDTPSGQRRSGIPPIADIA